MGAWGEPDVGERVRVLREQRRLSLRMLAQRSGLSVNAVSRIEHGESSPTVSSLHALARALDVPIVELFSEEQEATTVFLPRDRRLASRSGGVMMESLGSGLRNQQLEPFLITLEAQAEGSAEVITHPGQEFVLCLEGSVDYDVGGRTYRLEPGDALLFEATQPHRFQSVAAGPSILLLVFQAAEGRHLARQRHLQHGGVERDGD
jgi:transcriptional regulator with XRE-family HTH domain